MNKKAENSKFSKEEYINFGIAFLIVALLAIFCYSFGYSLLIPLILVALGTHLFFIKKASFKVFLDLGLMLFLLILGSHFVNQYNQSPYVTIPVYYIPVAGVAMLTMLLFKDLQISFIMSFLSSVVVTSILGKDTGIMLTFFLGSLAGVYTVKDARTRGQLLAAGLFVSFFHLICILLQKPDLQLILSEQYAKDILHPLVLNGFISALFVGATLKIFEYIFGVLTNFSLLELSDFNQPLLKRMILEAPGTYHHSLVVSNLSEAAADAIGANALLTRVGAYYHDIGKMVKSEYFTENQLVGGNKHDAMEPSMSRLVVLNHVKEGVDLAKKYNLNQAILDFIPQHHGTSLMYYFYQKALEEAEDGETVNENDFRYPGPKPQTRETAITLLADSVEGATRALDEQNPTNIEETVRKIVNNKFIDGQLDECPLTLKEIEVICETFTRILSAMYHGRVKYPEKKANGNSHRKSAEKDKNQSGSNQQDSNKGSGI